MAPLAPDLAMFSRSAFARQSIVAAILMAGVGCEGVGAPARVEFPADSAAGEVPLTLSGLGGAAVIVPVRLNGRGPYDLVLDTGATLTCLDEELARELELPEQRGVAASGVGLGGSGRVRLLRLDSLRVGAAVLKELTACALDLAPLRAAQLDARGLLGLNVLRQFRVVLDFERGVMRLEQP